MRAHLILGGYLLGIAVLLAYKSRWVFVLWVAPIAVAVMSCVIAFVRELALASTAAARSRRQRADFPRARVHRSVAAERHEVGRMKWHEACCAVVAAIVSFALVARGVNRLLAVYVWNSEHLDREDNTQGSRQ